jgi:pseudouridine kinase
MPGGVAYNVARTLTNLDCTAGLASCVGSDSSGSALISHIGAGNIVTSNVGVELSESTASYTAIVEPNGTLILGLADMTIYDRLDDEYWSSRDSILAGWHAWCIDTNLPESGVQYLCTVEKKPKLYVIATSPSKVIRLRSSLMEIDTLILNIVEASALTGQTYAGINGAQDAAQTICASGVYRTLVTAGASGAAWADPTGSGAIPAQLQGQNFKRYSGAGDSLAAVVIAALEIGHTTAEAIELGIHASALFIQLSDPETPLTWQLINTRKTLANG